MSEKIIIKNFGGMDYAEIDVGGINIYIGEQATGKSVVYNINYN
jgi:predicted ATPase